MGARTSSTTGSSFDTTDILLPGIFLATSAAILSTPSDSIAVAPTETV